MSINSVPNFALTFLLFLPLSDSLRSAGHEMTKIIKKKINQYFVEANELKQCKLQYLDFILFGL